MSDPEPAANEDFAERLGELESTEYISILINRDSGELSIDSDVDDIDRLMGILQRASHCFLAFAITGANDEDEDDDDDEGE